MAVLNQETTNFRHQKRLETDSSQIQNGYKKNDSIVEK